MLSDHLNSSEMTFITWFVIFMILLSVFIAIAEVIVKVLRLHAGLSD